VNLHEKQEVKVV